MSTSCVLSPPVGASQISASLHDLFSLSDERLARLDVASLNLLCAEGLPGAEIVDRDLCLRTIDRMAERVRETTQHAYPAFQSTPQRWDGSSAIFRMHVMVSVLQREFGVRYNPAKIPIDVPLDTDDHFVYGIIQGEGGTCGSLPVLYAAVGRRLGYPLKLVSAACANRWMHLFVRWDEPGGERHNVETNNQGFDCPPDDHYRDDHYRTRVDWEESGSILKSKTPREELATFLAQRAGVWKQSGDRRRVIESFAWARTFAPQNLFYRTHLNVALNEWHAELEARKPPRFPDIYVHKWTRRYPATLPKDLEYHILGLSCTEFLLNDPVNERKWWTPMRQGVSLPVRLARIVVDFTRTGYHVQLETTTNN